MRLLTFRALNAQGSTIGFTHRVERWVDQRPETVVECEILHPDDIDPLDCPVASRWTIIRSGSGTAAAALPRHAQEGGQSAVRVPAVHVQREVTE